MKGYRLTERGKIVVTILIIVVMFLLSATILITANSGEPAEPPIDQIAPPEQQIDQTAPSEQQVVGQASNGQTSPADQEPSITVSPPLSENERQPSEDGNFYQPDDEYAPPNGGDNNQAGETDFEEANMESDENEYGETDIELGNDAEIELQPPPQPIVQLPHTK